MNPELLPITGASLPIARLAEHRDWLVGGWRDLEITDPQWALDPSDWRPLVREARSLLDGYAGRLSVHGPVRDLPIAASDPAVRAVVAVRLHEALRFAGELGATRMVVHSPFLSFGSNPFVYYSPLRTLADEIGMVHATLETVLPAAEEIGCALVVENTERDTNSRPLLELVRSFGSQQVRMALDTGHALVAHRLGGLPPDQWVRDAGALIDHVHLQDTDGNADRHWAPGDGEVNWFGLFEALAALPHEPRLIVELIDPEPGAYERAASSLERRGLAR